MRLALDDAGAFSHLVNIHSPLFPEARYVALAIPGVKSLLTRVIRLNAHRWVHRNVHDYDESLKSLEEARAYGDPLDAPDGAEAFIHYLSEAVSPRSFAKMARTLEDRHRAGLAKLIDDAKLVWLEDSSHFPHVDSPERLIKEVLEFLG